MQVHIEVETDSGNRVPLYKYIECVIAEARFAHTRDQTPDVWLDSKQAANYLNTTVGQVRNLRSAGKLFSPSARGTKLRFRRSELDRYAAEQS